MRRLYIEKSSLKEVLDSITAAQKKANNFCNVAVKPYKGKKFDPQTTVVIVIG